MTDPLLSLWSASKGISLETLDRTGVTYWEHRLYFAYRHAGSLQAHLRYIDLKAFERGEQDKFWEPGSKGKGSFWAAYYDPYQAQQSKTVLICEGETDALAAIELGNPFSYVVSVPGAHMLDSTMFDALLAYNFTITVAFDRDDAGNAAADKAAWLMADRAPLYRLRFDEGVNDLREQVQKNVDITYDVCHRTKYPYHQERIHQKPKITPANLRPHQHSQHSGPKPDLNRVWDSLQQKSKHARRDGSGRQIRQAWCPIHEDGDKPAAWVGSDRWGCFACGIERADVYELVAWTQGYAQPGEELRGEAFRKAKDYLEKFFP